MARDRQLQSAGEESRVPDVPHRRYNSLSGDWVLVSPQRATRPWLGEVETSAPTSLPQYDPTCYLCPGNQRAGGRLNPHYTGTFVFDNDFAALTPDLPAVADQDNRRGREPGPDTLLRAEPERGLCRVICFSPRHDLTLPELGLAEVEEIIATWAEQTTALGSLDFIRYVQVFENKGAMMGCSNPHPHSQVWATEHIPPEPNKELHRQRDYAEARGRPLLADYLAEELARRERILISDESFTAVVPFWAVWPFEVLVIAHRSGSRLPDLTPAEVRSLADVLRQVTTRYDNLFKTSFPYSMGFHQAPFDGRSHPEWTLHAHFFPPLLRSANVRKFMVGFEMLAMPQRDITPEAAAAQLRATPVTHYRIRTERAP